MGSYKWSYKSPIWVISIVTLLITLLITTHEPPSIQLKRFGSGSLIRHCGSGNHRHPEKKRKQMPVGHSQVKVRGYDLRFSEICDPAPTLSPK